MESEIWQELCIRHFQAPRNLPVSWYELYRCVLESKSAHYIVNHVIPVLMRFRFRVQILSLSSAFMCWRVSALHGMTTSSVHFFLNPIYVPIYAVVKIH